MVVVVVGGGDVLHHVKGRENCPGRGMSGGYVGGGNVLHSSQKVALCR